MLVGEVEGERGEELKKEGRLICCQVPGARCQVLFRSFSGPFQTHVRPMSDPGPDRSFHSLSTPSFCSTASLFTYILLIISNNLLLREEKEREENFQVRCPPFLCDEENFISG